MLGKTGSKTNSILLTIYYFVLYIITICIDLIELISTTSKPPRAVSNVVQALLPHTAGGTTRRGHQGRQSNCAAPA